MTLSRRRLGVALAGFGFFAAVRARAAETVEVEMKQANSRFDPDPVEIKVGDTVNWTNPGFVTHTVTCDPAVSKTCVLPAGAPPFASPDMEEDKTFSHQFTVAGTYKYVCKYHESMGMIGTVIVS